MPFDKRSYYFLLALLIAAGSGREIQAYFDLDKLPPLRVEVPRRASAEQINSAYQKMAGMIFSFLADNDTIPAEAMKWKRGDQGLYRFYSLLEARFTQFMDEVIANERDVYIDKGYITVVFENFTRAMDAFMGRSISTSDNTTRKVRIDQLTKADRIVFADHLNKFLEYIYIQIIEGRFNTSSAFARDGVVRETDKEAWREAMVRSQQMLSHTLLFSFRRDVAPADSDAITVEERQIETELLAPRFNALVRALPMTDRGGIERFHLRLPKKSKWVGRDRPGYIDQFIGKITSTRQFDSASDSGLQNYFNDIIRDLRPATSRDMKKCFVIMEKALLQLVPIFRHTMAREDIGPKLEDFEKKHLAQRLTALIDYVVHEMVENGSWMDTFYDLVNLPEERVGLIQSLRAQGERAKDLLRELLAP